MHGSQWLLADCGVPVTTSQVLGVGSKDEGGSPKPTAGISCVQQCAVQQTLCCCLVSASTPPGTMLRWFLEFMEVFLLPDVFLYKSITPFSNEELLWVEERKLEDKLINCSERGMWGALLQVVRFLWGRGAETKSWVSYKYSNCV